MKNEDLIYLAYLAYQAVGNPGLPVTRHEWETIDPFSEGVDYMHEGELWVPTEDDGDAFRLAIKLDMQFGYNVKEDYYEAVSYNQTHRFGAADKCPRMAIVLCAAAMGEKQ
jgi:hypothetical protein